MDYFNYHENQLMAERVPIELIASQFATPIYVYSKATLVRHWKAFDKALGDHPHCICYSVKANSNLAILQIFAQLGSGFDIVSGGELARVLAAGGDCQKVVFSGVGKTQGDMAFALKKGIFCFNVESQAELLQLNQVAQHLNCQAPVALRVNPDVNPQSHPYISTGLKDNKFGIDVATAKDIYMHSDLPHIRFIGLDCHIGSQLTQLSPFLEALDKCLTLLRSLLDSNIPITHLNLGGGLGVRYHEESPPLPSDYALAIKKRLKGQSLKIILEPGRAIAANAGILVTKVLYLKTHDQKHFCIVDTGMNHLIRPALYQAYHHIIPVCPRKGSAHLYDVVGPICETGDFLGRARALCLQQGDYLAIRSAGAYGAVMASRYNSHPLPAEVMVDDRQMHLVRERESWEDLYQKEKCLPKSALGHAI